jgi:hypothetical protein
MDKGLHHDGRKSLDEKGDEEEVLGLTPTLFGLLTIPRLGVWVFDLTTQQMI